GKETTDTFGIQMEWLLAVRRIRSIGQYGDIGEVVSCPAFCLLIPPDDWLRSGIWFAVAIAGSAVIKDAHVVRPSPAEVWIQTQASRVRARVSPFGKIDSATK